MIKFRYLLEVFGVAMVGVLADRLCLAYAWRSDNALGMAVLIVIVVGILAALEVNNQ